MIKFFRRIRQKMLSENKFSKYLLYAIGEIVLVVIGILIALSINTTNQKIKRQELTQTYLKSLMVDIVQDTIEIEAIIMHHISDSLKISEHRNILTNDDATLDDVVKIMVNDWDPRIGSIRGFNTQTFDALVSTGNIDLIDPDILELLGKINRLQEEYLSFIGEFIDFYRKSGDPTIINPVGSLSVINTGPIFDRMIEEIDKVRLANNFNGKLTLKRQTNRVSISFLTTIQQEKIKLIKLINKKVN
ncbi:hypothetical protein JQC67_18865 [Aurantibacter crassamenti]|uniref:DUF6090 family protein n=1 Tax=Aurantibacter crassamenti TaxID=1837375 RepID=UPI001939AB1C|nr:DUF6090 family protein [Aurantibacter crassamenti]MBM1108222.1 hypothetical protein [Aurantibacter crassamenti]